MRFIKLPHLSLMELVLESKGVGRATQCSEPLLLLGRNHRVREMPQAMPPITY